MTIVGFGEINPQTGGKSLLKTTEDDIKSVQTSLGPFPIVIRLMCSSSKIQYVDRCSTQMNPFLVCLFPDPYD